MSYTYYNSTISTRQHTSVNHMYLLYLLISFVICLPPVYKGKRITAYKKNPITYRLSMSLLDDDISNCN